MANEADLPNRSLRKDKMLGSLIEITGTTEHPQKRALREHFHALFKRVDAAKLGAASPEEAVTKLRQIFDTDVWPWMPVADHGEVELADAIAVVPDDGLGQRLELLRALLRDSMPLSAQTLQTLVVPNDIWAATAVTHAAVLYATGLLTQLSRDQYATHADKIGVWTSHEAAEIREDGNITISGALYQYLTVYPGLTSAARQLRTSWEAHERGNKAKRHVQATMRILLRYLQNLAFAWEMLLRGERTVAGKRMFHWHTSFDKVRGHPPVHLIY